MSAFSRSAILPIHARLDAPADLTGAGVTIAFLDAGFYAHPDLCRPRDRILHFVDVNDRRARRADLDVSDASSWHGMMTSVVACGNGHLSAGRYRGLASEADLVLVRCGRVTRIAHDDIRRGLDWVLAHRERFNIRIANVSCGGDYEASYLADDLSQSAEALSRAGVFVCAAVGNAGHQPGHPVMPPASAPSVLAVGGLDDKNDLADDQWDLYHSSYGPTVDGLQKPEVIAPGIWVAAPILPGTPTAAQADLLERLEEAPASALREIIRLNPGVDAALDAAAHLEPPLIRQLVDARIRDHNVISGSYKHVDGTSFASPIVASLAAQMIQANPALTPQALRHILVSTARRLPAVPIDMQGWGIVHPRRAVERARAWRPSVAQ